MFSANAVVLFETSPSPSFSPLSSLFPRASSILCISLSMGLTASCLTAIDGVILNQGFKRRRALSDYCHELADVFPRTKLSVFSFSPLIVDSLPSLTFIPRFLRFRAHSWHSIHPDQSETLGRQREVRIFRSEWGGRRWGRWQNFLS